MITHTEWFSANELKKWVNEYERNGWAVRQILQSVTGNGYVVVFEEIVEGAQVIDIPSWKRRSS